MNQPPCLLKGAVIGCGNISPQHLKAWQRIQGVSIECVADIDLERAQQAAAEHHISHAARDIDDALSSAEFDFVDVCTPGFAHRDVVVRAAEAGKHVVCEKPLALTSEDAAAMKDACERAGVTLMVAFRYRFTPWAPVVRELVQKGEFGRPILWRHVIASSGPKMRYMFDRQRAGGFFMDLYVHHIDIAHFLFGELRDVVATGWKMKPESESPDTGTAILTFEQGDQLVISSTLGLPGWDWVWRPGSYSDFVGPRAVIKEPLLGSGPRGFLTVCTGPDAERRIEFQKQPGADDFVAELSHFVDRLRTGGVPRATGTDGVRATRAVELIYEAISERK